MTLAAAELMGVPIEVRRIEADEMEQLGHAGPPRAAIAEAVDDQRLFDDLVDAVDSLISTGLVDRARVGITGGSWLVTRLSRGRAACHVRAPSGAVLGVARVH